MISLEQLQTIVPSAGPRAGVFLGPLNESLEQFSIGTPRRQAAFLAQVAHESGGFRYVREIASGAAYEGRKDLGNVERGDGVRFKGRGLIQITGRANYRECSLALYGDADALLDHPELLETVVGACQSAAWWWSAHGLNELADRPNSFQAITKRINGGLNGYPDRLVFFLRAKLVLGC